jgi:hypothetical protein
MLLFVDVAGKKISIDAAPAALGCDHRFGRRTEKCEGNSVSYFSPYIFLCDGRNGDHSRCLLFDTPLDLIGRLIKQTVFQTTFHIGTR